MARKRLKRKRYSCKLCKPGKTGQSNRWSPKDEVALRRFEKAVHRHDWSAL
jgi:hypothetical protein